MFISYFFYVWHAHFSRVGHLKIMADSKSALRMAIPKVYSLQPMELLKYDDQIFVDWRP